MELISHRTHSILQLLFPLMGRWWIRPDLSAVLHSIWAAEQKATSGQQSTEQTNYIPKSVWQVT